MEKKCIQVDLNIKYILDEHLVKMKRRKENVHRKISYNDVIADLLEYYGYEVKK